MTAVAHRAEDAAPDSPPVAYLPQLAPLATLSVDLLPDEILVKRRLGYLKRRLVFVMIALVALVVLGDLLVRQQTNNASEGLAGANSQIATLNKRVARFNGILGVQSETQSIWTQLDGAMTNDVAWTALLNRLTSPAPSGVRVVSLNATVNTTQTTQSSTTGTAPVVANQIGSLSLTGSAPNWKSVATYVHRLSAVKGFAAVNPSTVANGVSGVGTTGSGLTFTVTLDLTSAVLSNRYAPPASTTSGTTTAASEAADSQKSASTRQPRGSGTGTTASTRSAHRRGTTSRSASKRSTGSTSGSRTTQTTQETN